MKYYITGFILSLFLTLAAYFVVVEKWFSPKGVLVSIIVLAVVQFIVQMIYFLRIAQETKPHWKLMLFFFMMLVLIVIVFGSLWIMSSLSYNLMDMNGY